MLRNPCACAARSQGKALRWRPARPRTIRSYLLSFKEAAFLLVSSAIAQLAWTMASRLCAVCSSISSKSSDFWSFAYDSPEYCQETFIKLQSYSRMLKEAEKECQLCSVLLNYPQPVNVEDKDTILILRRCPAYPDRAVRLGTGPKGLDYITRTFYRRLPSGWYG